MITSKQNALIKEIRSLRDKKFRDRLGVFVVEGIKPIKEALDNGLDIRNLIVSEEKADCFQNHLDNLEVVSSAVFDYISEEVTPQGALAVVNKPQNVLCAPLSKCIFLDGVADPANVGAIIRTAAASGYKDVYMTADCADAYSQKAVRASMSGIFRVNVMRGERAELLSTINAPLIVADMDGENVFDFSLNGKFCLVIGNEGKGVSQTVRERADYVVSIPMENGVESLNAAVSAGILMYELSRSGKQI